VEIARAHGFRVSFDLNHRAALWSRDAAAPEYEACIRLADMVFASEDELQIIAPTKDAETIARELVGAGVPEVIIKRGVDGATRVAADGTTHAPALPVRAVDPVGAGDAFVAGYLAGTLDGLSTDGRLALACAKGAYAVTFPGDCDGLPTRQDLELLRARSGHTVG
jgi:2-dehydro-3-deoxygluconokinase